MTHQNELLLLVMHFLYLYFKTCNMYIRDTEYVFYQNPVEDVHISLSRTVALQHHWIEPITSTLRDKFKEHRVFPLALSEVAFYCNEEKTRYIGPIH